ncbi:MAG TPA: SRPBCC domain-containing protein [Polyangiaceae bacterium]|jgi:hypothetical protein
METQPIMMKTVRLECPIARAFSLFTEQISEWWPPERRHTGDPRSSITLSQSGRFFERDSAGKEVELGAVLTWDPPQRLILDFYPGTDPAHPTRVEVRFTADGGATEVMILHSATKTSEALFPAQAPQYDASWNLVLASLRHAADSSTKRN